MLRADIPVGVAPKFSLISSRILVSTDGCVVTIQKNQVRPAANVSLPAAMK